MPWMRRGGVISNAPGFMDKDGSCTAAVILNRNLILTNAWANHSLARPYEGNLTLDASINKQKR